MSSLVLGFQEMNKKQLSLVGGKGLNLGELSKIEGLQVPEGFCVTTEGYQKAIAQDKTIQVLPLNNKTLLCSSEKRPISRF